MQDDAGRIIDLYERNARFFDTLRSRSLFERPWMERFAALLPQHGAVLDLGCGAGEPIARHFVEAGCNVTGVDSSPAMIAMCQARFPACDWIVADMRMLALGRRFDGILAWNSFFHLRREDQRAMFSIFRAHAVPGAALMFTSGPHDLEALATFAGEPLYHASLSPEENRALLTANGFAVVEHVSEDPHCRGHTVWLAQLFDF